ncbi:MAG TPA: DEAD/DEAH box helicase [Nitrososphaera sp.]|nr:DEAD/DEAH box helicase [Nitrososphaera sp.]
MTQTLEAISSEIPVVRSILEKAKNSFPDPYRWQVRAWEHMFGENSRDVLVIAATGSGKSLIFQCLHFVREDGVTLIVSPLTALMKDQVPRAI